MLMVSKPEELEPLPHSESYLIMDVIRSIAGSSVWFNWLQYALKRTVWLPVLSFSVKHDILEIILNDLIVLWGFYLPTWETYHTGVLYLGYVNGPTEGVIFGILMIMISAIYGTSLNRNTWTPLSILLGPGIFHETVETFFPNLAIPAILVGTKTGHLVFTFVFIAGLSLLIPSSLIAVYQHGRDQNHKKISLFSAIGELGFMGLTTLAVIGWLWSPYTTALKQHFILFHCAVGLAFGKMATKIILAHLTKQPFPTYTGLMMPLHIGAVLFNALPMLTSLDSGLLAKLEHVYLWAFMIVAIVGYANWIYHVISSFCKFLDINCLTIKKVKKTVEDTGTETEIKLINRGIEATMVLGGKRATSSPYRSRTRQAIL